MKILFLTKEFPYPVNNGARMRTWYYLRGLRKAADVHMVCYGRSEGQEEGLKVFREMGVDVVFEETEPPWRARPLILARLMSLFMPQPYSVLSRTSKVLKDKIRQISDESACDMIICDGIHMALNVPVDHDCYKILDEHNVESTIIGRFINLIKNPFIKIYVLIEWLKFRKFEESIWPKFDEVHVCSEVDRGQMIKRSKQENVKVVPNGVDVARYEIRDTRYEANRRLVYSGLMGWRPNDDAAQYFIKEIWPIIKENGEWRAESGEIQENGKRNTENGEGIVAPSSVIRDPLSLQFTIVGKDPTDTLSELAQNDSCIRITGFVHQVAPYIEEADVFVVPLRMGSGTRLKILEAMAMGKAIVSTSIGCEGLEVTHGKDILIADTPKDFADEVVRLLNDDQLRHDIALAGRKLVEEKYDWELIENDLAGAIKR